MKLLILAALVAACKSPPKSLPDGSTCYWRNDGGGISRTDGVCFKGTFALQCSYEENRDPQVKCASGCVPLESK